jgi:hypothetical protein
MSAFRPKRTPRGRHETYVVGGEADRRATCSRFMSSFVGEDVRPRHLADIATEGTASRRLKCIERALSTRPMKQS